MKIEIRASSHKRPHVDRFGQPATRVQHTTEVVIDGITFTHDCESAENARKLVIHLSRVLGIK